VHGTLFEVETGREPAPRQHPEGRHLFGRAAHVGRDHVTRELRAIADVAEKYDAPMVKVTGGRRFDIFGIRKEDLHVS
jgi:dissimilatory sulfite reductase (desulfoviridin) alpha/beta subunit